MGWRSLLPIFLFVVATSAKKNNLWESMFDVPTGFRSYAAQRDAGRKLSLDDMSMGFEGFLDEGLEGDVRVPTHVHSPSSQAVAATPRSAEGDKSHHDHHGHHHRKHELAAHGHVHDLEKQHDNHHKHGAHHHRHHRRHHHGKGSSFLQLSETMRAISPTSFLQLKQAQAGNVFSNPEPIASYSVGSRVPDSILAPSTFAVPPATPTGASPLIPKDELSWMVGGPEQKGLVLDAGKNPPERVDFKRLMDSFKAILRKGQKAIEMADRAAGQDDPNYKNHGFEGWPQPFWWTRPPNWLDDIPTWMQRLQMKKASSMHRSTPFV